MELKNAPKMGKNLTTPHPFGHAHAAGVGV